MKRKIVTAVLTAALLFGNTAVWAAEGTESAASESSLQIKLTIGSESIEINGETMEVEKPFLADDTTLVPLRVITTAFGAKVSWEGSTQTVGLEYDGHKIEVQIGNTEATVDGESFDLPTAPQLVNDTTMVPIRFISENFGAVVKFDPDTMQVTISGDAAEGGASEDIDIDAGKTHLGDSYYGWTMKYPSGLIKTDSSFKGNYILFEDANGEFELSVYVEEDADELTLDGLLNKLADGTYDTILSKNKVTNVKQPYARVVSKSSEGQYFKERAYYKNDKAYYVYMTINEEKNYKNTAKAQSYKELLDSFTLSFDKESGTIKDFSTVVDGFRTYTSELYGFGFKLPADFVESGTSSNKINFEGPAGSDLSYSVEVTSVDKGDTLDKWIARVSKEINDMMLPDYRKESEIKPVTVDGISGKQVSRAVSTGAEWYNGFIIYVIVDELKYEFSFSYTDKTTEADIKKNTDNLLNSILFSEDFENELGFIQDELSVPDVKSVVKNKEGKFTIEAPEKWEKSSQPGKVEFTLPGGGLIILTTPSAVETKEKVVRDFMYTLNEKIKAEPTTKLISNQETTLAGVSTQKIVYEATEAGIPVTNTVYVLTKGSFTYLVITVIGKPMQTTKNLNDVSAAVNSFTITE